MYKLLCVGGTFDGIHAGHEALLEMAFDAGEQVLIGLTSPSYVKAHKAHVVGSYTARKAGLLQWLRNHRDYDGRFAVVVLHDPFGPSAKDAAIEAIVVSQESKKRGEEANVMRKKSGFPPLDILTVPMVVAEDKAPISTSRIREGKITAWGKLILPDSMRNDLAQPLGVVLSHDRIRESIVSSADKTVITVGDMTTKTLLEAGLVPRIMIVDNKVGRRPYTGLRTFFDRHEFPTMHVASGPGYISDEAAHTITQLMQHCDGIKPTVVDVDGEEDLLALVVIREAPLGSVVYYGQPPVAAWACGPDTEGIVEVTVTLEKQREAIELLRQFVHNT